MVGKVGEGDTRILELIKRDEIKLIINTPSGQETRSDMKPIRSMAVIHAIPCITTIQGAQAAVNGIETMIKKDFKVKSLQEYLKVKTSRMSQNQNT